MLKRFMLAGATLTLVAAYGLFEYGAKSLCLRRVSLQGASDGSLSVGDSIQLRAGRLDLMMECDLDPPLGVRLRSSNPALLSVATSGWIKAQAAGHVDVIARAGLTSEARWPLRIVAERP